VAIGLDGGILTVEVSPLPAGGPDAARSLGTHFAQAAMRAQGGALVIEAEATSLVFRLTLAAGPSGSSGPSGPK
jgi:hypothetical protein